MLLFYKYAYPCIIEIIIDAAASIKSPTDVIILSSTPLGFNTSKSKNYKFCEKLYHILTEKGCKIHAAVCQGKGYELNSFVNLFINTERDIMRVVHNKLVRDKIPAITEQAEKKLENKQ